MHNNNHSGSTCCDSKHGDTWLWIWELFGAALLFFLFLKSSQFGYMLSSEAAKEARLRFFVEFRVAVFRGIAGSIFWLHITYVSIWVATSNCTWRAFKATCMFNKVNNDHKSKIIRK